MAAQPSRLLKPTYLLSGLGPPSYKYLFSTVSLAETASEPYCGHRSPTQSSKNREVSFSGQHLYRFGTAGEGDGATTVSVKTGRGSRGGKTAADDRWVCGLLGQTE